MGDLRQSPTIAIVGRPNVGKSTLFNRLVGRRQAIVHDQPGVTRDRIVGEFEVDAAGKAHLIDTGGLLLGDEDRLGLNEQVWIAVEESDLLLFVVDGKAGLTAADEQIAERLRRADRPILTVINKSDAAVTAVQSPEFYRLGLQPLVEISAEHGLGLQDLHERMLELLPRVAFAAEEEGDEARLALVGRPNVGKSSLLNRLVGGSRALVSPTAGTTRDPIDTTIEADGKRYVLVDTAGIRRRSRTSGATEALAVMMAKRQLERSDVALLVIEAQLGATSGDLAIAGAAWEMGRALVVVVNKWDLVDEPGRQKLETSWARLEEIGYRPARINVSALTGRGIEKILPSVETVLERLSVHVPTNDVNSLFDAAVREHHAPTVAGRPWKVLYATQVSTAPPTFMVFANRLLPHGSSYRRYLENYLRRALKLDGIPVRLVIRRRSGRGSRE